MRTMCQRADATDAHSGVSASPAGCTVPPPTRLTRLGESAGTLRVAARYLCLRAAASDSAHGALGDAASARHSHRAECGLALCSRPVGATALCHPRGLLLSVRVHDHTLLSPRACESSISRAVLTRCDSDAHYVTRQEALRCGGYLASPSEQTLRKKEISRCELRRLRRYR